MDARASVAVVIARRSRGGGARGGAEFLILRRVPARGGGWQPVTGRVETGEDAAEAAAREVREETGCAPLSIVDLGLEAEFTGFDGHRYRERAFLAEVEDGAEARTDAEHDAAEWLALDAALARLTWEENRAAVRVAARLLASER